MSHWNHLFGFVDALSLKEEEQATIDRSVDAWRAARTSTEPADRPRAEAAIARLYARIEQPAPRFVWCDSPAACVQESQGRPTELARALYQDLRETFSAADGYMRARWHPSRDRSDASRSLRRGLMIMAGGSFVMWDVYVGRRCGVYIAAALLERFQGFIGFEGQDGPMISCFLPGWTCANELLGDEQRVREFDDILPHWQAVTHSAGWWLPCADVCFVSERMSAVRLDAQGRPHAPEQRAVEFRDGWGACALNGEWLPSSRIF